MNTKIYKMITMVLICAIMITCTKVVTMAVELNTNYEEAITIQPQPIILEVKNDDDNENQLTDCLLRAGVSTVLIDYYIPMNDTLVPIVEESEDIIIESEDEESSEKINITDSKYTDNEIYELAKIIMCEAEGEPQKCKEYVGQVVMNRVNSNKFPDNIHDVIFQKNSKGVAQFSPTIDGRWESVEPNEECYEAAYTVLNSSKSFTEALYFEACTGDSWHSRNLTQIHKIGKTRFYI